VLAGICVATVAVPRRRVRPAPFGAEPVPVELDAKVSSH
jgi:hypothetical protein